MTTRPAAGRQHLAYVASLPCCAPGCHARASEAAHVAGAISAKTRQPLPRRYGVAYAVAVPLCAACHRTSSSSVHALGERGWERHHGLPDGWLLGVAASLLAQQVMRLAY